MIKMYRGKCFRGRNAVRWATVAFAVAAFADSRPLLAGETKWNLSSNNGLWGANTSWTAGAPVAGSIADLYLPFNVNYNLSSGIDFGPVQIAGGSGTATLTLSTGTATNPTFQAADLYVGGTFTGLSGGSSNTGPGAVAMSAGTINIDSGGLLAVDTTSNFVLNGGVIVAYTETLGGTFSESVSTSSNTVLGGAILNNFGSYGLAAGTVKADTITNSIFYNSTLGMTYTGNFNQSGGTVQGQQHYQRGIHQRRCLHLLGRNIYRVDRQ